MIYLKNLKINLLNGNHVGMKLRNQKVEGFILPSFFFIFNVSDYREKKEIEFERGLEDWKQI